MTRVEMMTETRSGQGQTGGGQRGGQSASSSEDNVWSSILAEVRTNASIKMPSGKSVVLLGGSEVGKTTLVAKLQGTEAPKKGCGLEYAYIEIRDEYRDDSTQLSVWVVDGCPSHSNLLRFTLSERTFSDTLIILTVSMATPWSIIEDLQKWAGILHDHVDSLQLSPDRITELRQKLVNKWNNYVEPGADDLVVGSDNGVANSNKGQEQVILPHNVLSRNTGLDIVVVVTKTDSMSVLERDGDYREEHFDFIQFHIRSFCLQYGAALFYTSVKAEKNCDLLYKYLVHKLYALPFKTPALCVEKDAVFIPSGWDNEGKMSILHENLTSFGPEEYFNDIILKPLQLRKGTINTPTSNSTHNSAQANANNSLEPFAEIEVEDEQKFLERQWNALNTGTPGGQGLLHHKGPSTTPSPNAKNLQSNKITPTNTNTITTPKKGDPTSQERVLAHFFNSLLSKKTPTSTGGSNQTTPTSTNQHGKSTTDDRVRSEVAAELDSLLNNSSKNEANTNSLQSSDC